MGEATKLAKALIVTAEVMGHELSPLAAEMMARDLSGYDSAAVHSALERCRREVRTRLTLADVIARIDDGHIGVEQAWALCPRSEAASVVWTDEIARAFEAARPLLAEGDQIGARMAFKEAYTALLAEARNERRPAKWWPSLGHNPVQREIALQEALAHGRLSADHVRGIIGDVLERPPALPPPEDGKRLHELTAGIGSGGAK